MSRRKKQPEASLSALEHIPAVKEALLAIGLEMVIRPKTEANIKTHYIPSIIPREVIEAAMVKPGDIVINTPERQEWEPQNAEVAAALQAERALTNPPQAKPKTLPAAQRAAIEKGMLSELQAERAAKMAQFKHDGPPEPNGVEAMQTEELTTLSEVT